MQEGRWGRKVAFGLLVVVAWGAYLDNKWDAESEALSAEFAQSQVERDQQSADFDQSAACTATALSRGAVPASAVNNCVTGSMVEAAVFLSGCLEGALPESYSRVTLADVDYYWTDCIMEQQYYDDRSDYY